MAGRNKKTTAEYFSHDVDASSDEKLIYLESLFGHTGYALYFKFLERMARSDGFKIEWNNIKKAIYASEFNISVTEIDKFVSESCRHEIKAFKIEDGMMFSSGLLKRMQPLLEKREYNRKKYEEKKANEIKDKAISVTDKTISVTEMIQSKGKESKGKERKVKNKSTLPLPQVEKQDSKNIIDDFKDFWVMYNKPVDKKKCAAKWKKLKKEEKQIVFDNLPGYVLATPDKQYRKNPCTWLNNESWKNELPKGSKNEKAKNYTGKDTRPPILEDRMPKY